ncbi:AIPR family protein [Kitasatospora sp. NBC_01266]|uniref:AIPR family protein n=1 Tax=Kitasatospora sp. NBC_01266 TaxID=2903572 RepID=UPI002E333792|nr:AIPR family protein [Kitasatospora sp. NBC_01266]
MSNAESTQPTEIEKAFLSRALAALAVRRLTGCDSAEAAAAVIDGRADQGIDAVAISEDSPHLWLVQAKWRETGTAGFDGNAARALVDGFQKIESREFGRFNERFQAMAKDVEAVLRDHSLRITLVIALMGDGHIHPDVQAILDDNKERFGHFGPWLDQKVLTAADFWQTVKDDVSPEPLSIVARMGQWHSRPGENEAYYGVMQADDVAEWYEQYEERLFEQNVRRSLGRTEVNQGITDTLLKEPQSFWERNNGIVLLCDGIEARFWGSRRSRDEPVELSLKGASVVNGAQTVTAIHRAWQQNPEAVRQADVSVRIMRVGRETAESAVAITRSTNTQNRIERRDLIASDPVHSDIRDDFLLSLEKAYVFKRGELDPAPEAGCSMLQAAVALACAHHNPDLVVRAKQNLDNLWAAGAQGAYRILFGRKPSPYQLWRAVRLHRAVGETLQQRQLALTQRPSAIAEHGDLLVAHMVFQLVGQEGMDDPDSDWEKGLAVVPKWVDQVLAHLIHCVNEEIGGTAYVSTTFVNEQRCRQLVTSVLDKLAGGALAPSLAVYAPERKARRPRRPTTVALLVDGGRIEDGVRVVYQTGSEEEALALAEWLAADPLRSQATWVNDRMKPLLWEADGKRYSPTGLTTHMWKLADWGNAWSSVQGPKQWALPGEGTLVELAEQLWNATKAKDDETEI